MEERRAVRRGEAESLSGARKYRGRCKVQIQAYLSAIVQNLKRLVALIYYWLAACWLRKQTTSA